MTTEYDESRKIQKMHAKLQVALLATRTLFFAALGVAALVLAFKL